MRHRVTAAAVILPLVLTAGCTSSGHKGSTSTGTGNSGSSSTNDGTLLIVSRQIKLAVATLSSAAITIDAGGLIATTTGHLKLSAGKGVASDFTIGSGADATRVIVVGTETFAEPPGQASTGKPYIRVTADSTSEVARGLASTLPILEAAMSLGDLADLLTTATNFVVKTPAQHYSFDVTGDTKGSALQQQLADLSTKPVPVDLYVNAQNLPVKIVLTVNLGGSALPVTATLSDFNAPVTITAPPANQVASG